MGTLKIRLLGKFKVSRHDEPLEHTFAPRLQQFFSYLLLFRDRPHPRETLAELFWGNNSTTRSKKYLRQALWQIQSTLADPQDQEQAALVKAEPEWVMLSSAASLCLDVAEFEQAANLSVGVPGRQIDAQTFQLLRHAAGLYAGDLLEGCYQDWCLFERERLQNMYLALLDKLMDYCEAHQEYETGLVYGMQILRYDRARERTHRRMMRLYFFSGQRTEALRQYQRCVESLIEELDVRPSKRTLALYEQVRLDRLEEPPSGTPPASADLPTRPLSEVLGRLNRLHQQFSRLQEQIKEDIKQVERAMHRQH